MTNYEKVKSMSVEEMADFIGKKPFCTLNISDCVYGWYNDDYDCREHAKCWLESEVTQNEQKELKVGN